MAFAVQIETPVPSEETVDQTKFEAPVAYARLRLGASESKVALTFQHALLKGAPMLSFRSAHPYCKVRTFLASGTHILIARCAHP